MIIAIDFDGTIVEHAYPKIGKPIPFAIETLKMLQNDGHQLILWTVRRKTAAGGARLLLSEWHNLLRGECELP